MGNIIINLSTDLAALHTYLDMLREWDEFGRRSGFQNAFCEILDDSGEYFYECVGSFFHPKYAEIGVQCGLDPDQLPHRLEKLTLDGYPPKEARFLNRKLDMLEISMSYDGTFSLDDIKDYWKKKIPPERVRKEGRSLCILAEKELTIADNDVAPSESVTFPSLAVYGRKRVLIPVPFALEFYEHAPILAPQSDSEKYFK